MPACVRKAKPHTGLTLCPCHFEDVGFSRGLEAANVRVGTAAREPPILYLEARLKSAGMKAREAGMTRGAE